MADRANRIAFALVRDQATTTRNAGRGGTDAPFTQLCRTPSGVTPLQPGARVLRHAAARMRPDDPLAQPRSHTSAWAPGTLEGRHHRPRSPAPQRGADAPHTNAQP